MSDLFGPPDTTGRARVYTIPPGANFLDEFAARLAEETGLRDNPEALADALIYVPNRRSERALAFALHQAGGRQASLLPDIRALGDLETDDPPPSAETVLADLPPVIAPAKRIGALTRLVMAYFEAHGAGMPAASCLSAARELARLLDQAALSGNVDWAQLKALVPDVQLAVHWEQSLEFLSIITEQWPAQLEDATAMDPYARRYAAAEAMAREWQARPPESPVIIAGSTGATPASRLLMQAALQLPKGLVVLPGLDRDLTPEALERIAAAPSHPQFTLARTLSELGLDPVAVAPWPERVSAPAAAARRRLIHEALAPAPSTADWTLRLSQMAEDRSVAQFVEEALTGLTMLDAKDDTEEALLAALMLRETLEHEGRTAALVTPDAGLARHVSAMLKRWEIDVSPSAGWPLPQTNAGSLAMLVADWLLDPSCPVALVAVLNHPYCRFDVAAVQALDRTCLRGPRLWQDWPGLLAHIDRLADSATKRSASATSGGGSATFDQLSSVLVHLSATLSDGNLETPEQCLGTDWLRLVSDTASQIARDPQPWSGEDGAALARLMRHLSDLSEPLGPQPPQIWNELLKSEALMVSVHTASPHPRLAIWGPLEARLQTADRLILAGLNEGIWPAQPPAEAFLPRVFRHEIGLADPDERIGLAAHDFAQLAAAPNVTLLSSQRRDDKPAVTSRWVWRLKTLARGALGNAADAALAPPPDANPSAWLERLEQAPEIATDFTAEPRPTPPLSARPKKLSVTRIEQLVRDPYAVYCEYVLGLRRLDPLNLPPDVRIRGTAIHKALEDFEKGEVNEDAEGLLSLLEKALREGGEPEADIIALRDRRRAVSTEYLDWRAAQKSQMVGDPLTEERGEISLDIKGKPFTLSGTADRIEQRVGGGAAILDFKSGKPPTEKQVRAGLNPQMPLQGLIAREGGYKKLGKADVEALTYLRFGTTFDVREIGEANARAKIEAAAISDIIADAEEGLIRLLTAFADPTHPYLSAPRPERVAYESDYSRLARRKEWTGLSTYD
jgi:ATP-dependent helicase/nuclease subunit B